MGALIALLFVAGYAVLVVALIRWARRRLYKRARMTADALEAKGANILAVTPSTGFGVPAQVDFEMGGKRGCFQVRRYGRDWILLSLRIACHPLPAILIRDERATDRVGKALGLNREVQIGDAAFDEAAYIVSNASDEIVREVLATAEVRESVLRVLEQGYRVEMAGDGLRATRIQYGLDAFDPTPVSALMGALEALGPMLPKVDPSAITEPRVRSYSRLVLGCAIFSIVSIIGFFSTVRIMRPPLEDSNSLKAIGVGVLCWVISVVVVGRTLRAHARGFAEVGLSALALFFGVPFAVTAALFLVNSGLDASAPTTHTTQVVSSKRHKDDNDVRVVPWDPALKFQKIHTDFATYKTLHPGDTVEVDVHPGTLGWPWQSAVRKVP